jgi:hypothetical protein
MFLAFIWSSWFIYQASRSFKIISPRARLLPKWWLDLNSSIFNLVHLERCSQMVHASRIIEFWYSPYGARIRVTWTGSTLLWGEQDFFDVTLWNVIFSREIHVWSLQVMWTCMARKGFLIASMFIATKPTRAVGHVAIIAPGTARPQYLWLGQTKGKGSQ